MLKVVPQMTLYFTHNAHPKVELSLIVKSAILPPKRMALFHCNNIENNIGFLLYSIFITKGVAIYVYRNKPHSS